MWLLWNNQNCILPTNCVGAAFRWVRHFVGISSISYPQIYRDSDQHVPKLFLRKIQGRDQRDAAPIDKPRGYSGTQRPSYYSCTLACTPTDGGPDPREPPHHSWFRCSGQPANYCSKQSVYRQRLRSTARPGAGKELVGANILSIRAAVEEMVMLSLVHGVDGNIEMRLLPVPVDVAGVAHAATGAPVAAVTPGENRTFVDDHECERVGYELVSAGVERSKPEAEAAGIAGTAGAGDWNLGQLCYWYH